MLRNTRSVTLAVLTVGVICQLQAVEPPVQLPKYYVEESAAGTGSAAVVLTNDDWRGRAIATLGDAIGRTPGLILQESFGGFEPPRLSIRGSGLQSAPSSRGVALTIDGLPLNLADGSFNSALFTPQIAEKIELSEGFDAWLTSPTTMGGSINLVSLHEPTNTFRSEAGSFGAVRANVSSGTKFANETLVGAAGFERQEGSRSQSAQQRPLFFGGLRNMSPTSGETAISVFYIRPKYEVPGPLTLAVAESAPRSASSDVMRDLPDRESELWRAAINTHGQASTLNYDGGVAYQHTTDWFRQLQANGISDTTSDDLSLRGGLSRQVEIAGIQQSFHLSTTASRGWRDTRRYLNNSSESGTIFDHDGLYATTATITIEDGIQVSSKLLATLGGSSIYSRRDIVDRLPVEITPVRTTHNLSQSANLAAAGLQWSATPEQAVFARFTQAAEPPTFDDLIVVTGTYPNLSRRSQVLSCQRAGTFEIGTRGQLGPVEWNSSVYRSEWQNEILRLADANGLPRGAVNAGPTLHTGIEASVRWKIYDHGQRLTLSAQNVWSRFTFDNDPLFGSNRLAGIPPCTGSAELFYEHPGGFFAASGLSWAAGRTPVDHAGRMAYGGHALASVRAGWRLGKAWSIYTEVQNIFDRQYIASTAGVLDVARNPAATSVFLPGNGRTFTIGIEWGK